MSKQNIGKGNTGVQAPGAKGAPNRAGTKPTGSLPPSNKNNGAASSKLTNGTSRPGNRTATAPAPVRTARTTGGRATQVPVKRKSGFRLRPLDIGLLLAGVLVVVFIVMSALQAPAQPIDPNAQITASGTPVAMGAAAPDFSLPGIDGQTYTLSSFKGHPVVLEFMATWCPHCQATAPILNQLDATYKPKGVQILAINATPYGHDHETTGSTSPVTTSDLKWFHDTYNVTYPMLFDKTLKSANDYQVVSYPSIYMVDKNGNIAFQPTYTTDPDLAMLSGPLDQLLAK